MSCTAFACVIRKMHTSADFRHGTTLGPLHRAININGRILLDDAGLSDSASDLNRIVLWARTLIIIVGYGARVLAEITRRCWMSDSASALNRRIWARLELIIIVCYIARVFVI